MMPGASPESTDAGDPGLSDGCCRYIWALDRASARAALAMAGQLLKGLLPSGTDGIRDTACLAAGGREIESEIVRERANKKLMIRP